LAVWLGEPPNATTVPNAGKYESKARQLALTSQKALIFGNVAARTWNFALGTRNVAISDFKRVAEVLPGHW
jgi:hypothetical protein